jgi:hypothetical protein
MFKHKYLSKGLAIIIILFGVVIAPQLIHLACTDDEDACDKAKQECTDSGGTPRNCKESNDGCEQKCTCECYSSSNSYNTSGSHIEEEDLYINMKPEDAE